MVPAFFRLRLLFVPTPASMRLHQKKGSKMLGSHAQEMTEMADEARTEALIRRCDDLRERSLAWQEAKALDALLADMLASEDRWRDEA